MHSSLAKRIPTILATICLVYTGVTSAATQAGAARSSSFDALVVEDMRLEWRHNGQVLELVASGDGLLVTKASAALALELQRGDRVRTAGRTPITDVAHLIAALRTAANNPIDVHVLRDGVQVRLRWTAAAYAPLVPPTAPSLPTSR